MRDGVRGCARQFYDDLPDVQDDRQQYANVGIARYMAFHAPRRFVPFSEVLEQFRRYGRLYDMGWRLGDSRRVDGAA